MGKNVNIFVLDTEVYSNTGGQQSKSTPFGASAKFATGGKKLMKKDLGLIAMANANAYVAKIAMGANEAQAVKAIREAESFDGPSLIIAYAPCIAHGFDLVNGPTQTKAAVESGHWPLYRFDPRLITQGKAPLQMDSRIPTLDIREYLLKETRYRNTCNIYELAENVEGILSTGNQTGEGWFLTAEMVELIKDGINNIVCVQPFACLPNHIVGKAVIKKLRTLYKDSNIVAIDYDPGASHTNQVNRIKLMLTVAKDNLKNKKNQ